jgi:hypothetical protein
MDVEGDRVAFYGVPSFAVFVNGAGATVGEGLLLPNGGRITSSSGTYVVSWPSGSQVRVRPANGYLNVKVLLVGEHGSQVEGLLGNFDGISGNDLVMRGGTSSLGTSLTYDQLYRQYGESWRVKEDQSLFDYAPGTSTGTYTDRSFPVALVTVAMLAEQARLRAEQICRGAGVNAEVLLAACILDVVLTGDDAFAQAGLEASLPIETVVLPTDGAVVVNINARTHSLSNPARANLGAGSYHVVPLGIADGGSYDAWSRWATTSCRNQEGCVRTFPTSVTGWENLYWVSSPQLAEVSVQGERLFPVSEQPQATSSFFLVADGQARYLVVDPLVHPDSASALRAAKASDFTLNESTTVSFAVDDTALSDNRGGMSLLLIPSISPSGD